MNFILRSTEAPYKHIRIGGDGRSHTATRRRCRTPIPLQQQDTAPKISWLQSDGGGAARSSALVSFTAPNHCRRFGRQRCLPPSFPCPCIVDTSRAPRIASKSPPHRRISTTAGAKRICGQRRGGGGLKRHLKLFGGRDRKRNWAILTLDHRNCLLLRRLPCDGTGRNLLSPTSGDTRQVVQMGLLSARAIQVLKHQFCGLQKQYSYFLVPVPACEVLIG